MSGFDSKQFGKYYLVDKLAMGGMAEIYKAKTFGVDGFEKLLAIKRILPHCAADKDFITMLIDEAKLSVLLSHANIVQVYDLGKIGDDYFISMEYIHGINLKDLMYRCRETKKALPVEIGVYIASEICKGLDYAHRKTDSEGKPLGIVHRDVSPQNILLSYEGEVKIVDFGIAKAAMNISHTMAGILKGKIAYMSPEQAMGKAVDPRTDLFSAGILLFEMLTNSRLFTGESQFEVLKKIRTTKIEANTLPNTIPENLKPVVSRALAYRPEDRFQSAGDLQIELTKFLYSTYLDFSPRKLAAFIKEIFTPELKEEQMKRAKELALESQTASMNVLEGAKQLEIVHRETSLTPVEARGPRDTLAAPEITTKRKAKAEKKKKKPMWLKIGAALAALTGVAYGLYRFAPIERFWEKPVAEEMGILEISSNPAGARILMDGKDTRKDTPAVLENIPLGIDHRITVSKTDYEDFEQTINLSSSKPQKIATVLRPAQKPAAPPPVPVSPPPAPPPVVETVPPPAPPVTEIEKKAEFGSISITSNPSGAKILLDGKQTGTKTPSAVENLKVGKTYTIGLVKNDFEHWSKKITVASVKPLTIEGELKAVEKAKETAPPKQPEEAPMVSGGAPGQIKIASNPSDAEVFVNAEFKGKTPLTINVPSGSVSVLVNKEGYVRYSRKITVRPGEKVSLTDINLADLYGEVSLSSLPPRASVVFDGQAIPAKTPVTIRKVRRDQSHSVSISLEGYKTWTHTFNMESGDKNFNITLENE